MKSRPRVLDVPLVDVAFQENVDILETLVIDRRIEDVEILSLEIGAIDEVNILGELEDRT